MEQNEIWKDIEGYEGLYQVSNLGRVKSLERIDRHNHLVKERILKPKIEPNGYFRVDLCKEGKVKTLSVHRLVAQTFIPNPEGLPQINHKNENKALNVVFLRDDGSVDECRSNLEWCDRKYNCNYGTRNERQVQTGISKGLYDPEMCGIIKNEGEKEYKRLWWQKNKDKINSRRRKKKQPSEESLW